jgi:hypothetical protein
MKNELLYLGIGAAAVYLFARSRRDVAHNVSTPATPAAAIPAQAPSVIPGVTPGTTPSIAPIWDFKDMPLLTPEYLEKTKQPLGLDAGGNIVFGADATVDQPAVYKINPVDIDVMVAALQNYAKTQNVSIKAAYERYLDIYVNGGDMVNVDIVNAAWNKLNPVVAKAGIGMLATVAALAAGYYVIVNH